MRVREIAVFAQMTVQLIGDAPFELTFHNERPSAAGGASARALCAAATALAGHLAWRERFDADLLQRIERRLHGVRHVGLDLDAELGQQLQYSAELHGGLDAIDLAHEDQADPSTAGQIVHAYMLVLAAGPDEHGEQ
jgi:hypothetical protein